jgi:hypothetical protein
MTSIQTYPGVIREGRIQLTAPANLPEGSQVYVHVADEGEEAILLNPHLARRKANGWLVSYVGHVIAQQPQLKQIEDRLVWQFKAFLTMRGYEPQGPVGTLDVDAYTGEVLASEDRATEMIANASALASSLLSSNS